MEKAGQEIEAEDKAETDIRISPRNVWLKRAWLLRHAKVGVGLGVVVVAAILPLLTDDQYVLDVVSTAGLWILLGCGLNVVVSLAGLLDLGYIAFWAVGAYTAALLASPQFHLSVPFLLLIPAAVAVTSVFAILIGLPTLRLRGDYLAIVTLGFGEIVRISLNNLSPVTGGPSGIQGINRPGFFGYTFGYQLDPYYYLIMACCLVALFIGFVIRNSALGLTWQALRDDELAARTSGIRPLTYYLLAFAIGAAFAGVSGTLFATEQLSVSPDSFTVDQSFLVLSIVVLAGLSGRFWPVMVSGFVIIVLPEALRQFQDYRLVVFGPVLVLVIIVRDRWTSLRDKIVGRLGDRDALGTDLEFGSEQ